ncbi:hypothetical protein LIPSTDRAFT_266424 [Lipomyces starkeyi NRRL Y-11557]|uniref:Uncharacterized protein n=1 Tax=Lipomyces starkeyi NRRL Y-11557 TaxID=675824 RepID=A0A1E3Q7T1_LIPST|nr:hypothetical protein LIPSTDRAFT_266424 [Lipomyces starkeyi NRRL Y-11557]
MCTMLFGMRLVAPSPNRDSYHLSSTDHSPHPFPNVERYLNRRCLFCMPNEITYNKCQ